MQRPPSASSSNAGSLRRDSDQNGLPARPRRPSTQTNGRQPNGARHFSTGIDTVVTRLLVSTKNLLENLTSWSQGRTSDDQISDIYVKLGNDFNAACATFARENISMDDLMSVPDELRGCLENCLSAEKASEATLERFLPQIKNIIVHLLQGLKSKQALYKEVLERRQNAPPPALSQMRAGTPSPTSSVTPANRPLPSSQRSSTQSQQSQNNSNGTIHGRQPSVSSTRSLPSPTSSQDLRRAQGPSSGRPPTPDAVFAAPYPKEKPPPVPPGAYPGRRPSLPNSRPTTPQPPPALPTLRFDAEPLPAPPPEKAFDTLKNSDNLMRRASKRFSKYTFDKMGAATPQASPARPEASPRSKERRPPVPPPPLPRMLSYDSRRLSTVGEPPVNETREIPEKAKALSESYKRHLQDLDTQKLPVLDQEGENAAKDVVDDLIQRQSVAEKKKEEEVKKPISVFVQLGKQTKKVKLDPDPDEATLKVLFTDKFGYHPGLEDFPAIYIRDPITGVEYELEEMDEIRDGVVLSLNVESLDQVKQHIDTGLLNLSHEIKDLKSSLVHSIRRASVPAPSQFGASPNMNMTSPPLGSNQAQFTPSQPQTPITQLQQSPKQPFSPSAVTPSKTSFKNYYEEVQTLRRDLAVLRQVYSDYTTEHKTVISTLRTQCERVRDLANTKVSGSRAFIDAGKSKLDGQSQDLLASIEGLMDAVEGMRDDVTVRRVRPTPSKLAEIKKNIESTREGLDNVRNYVNTVKPAWKKSWSEELRQIVEEQQFLKHQEGLLEELVEDHREMANMFDNIDELVKKQSITLAGGGPKRLGLREYVPPDPDSSHGGLSTVMTEVKSLAVDPQKRMRAIAQAEKARDKQVTDRKANNEFAAELGGFVEQKKLKKTGGAEETERVRTLKNEATLKSMFSAAVAAPLPDSPKSSTESHLQL